MEIIGKICEAEIRDGDILTIQYFDGEFSYGSPIHGKIVYYDFGYKIKEGNHHHRLDGFVWWNGKSGFKILEHKK